MTVPDPMAPPTLRRRQLLGAGALLGLGLLGGCRGPAHRLVASRGDLPQPWSKALPSPWQIGRAHV